MNPKLHKYAKLLVSEYNKFVDSLQSDELAGLGNHEELISILEAYNEDYLEGSMSSAYGRAFLMGLIMSGAEYEYADMDMDEIMQAMEGDDDAKAKKTTH